MKILQISKLYFPWIGGVETVVQQIAEGLDNKNDLKMEVLCCLDKGERKTEEINKVKVWRASSLGIFWGMPVSFDFFWLFKKLKDKYDVIDFHHPFPLGDLVIFLFRSKTKLTVHYHSDIVRQKILEIFFKPLIFNTLKRAEKIIVSNPNLIKNSPYLRKFKEKCVVIPFGIDLKKFEKIDFNNIQKRERGEAERSVIEETKSLRERERGESERSVVEETKSLRERERGESERNIVEEMKSLRERERGESERNIVEEMKSLREIKEKYKDFVLFVGRLNYYKGVQYLVEAMKEIDANLVIIGQGAEKSNLELKIKEFSLENKVFFLPPQGEKELINFYQAAKIFVLPSIFKSEAFGIVLIEAMACGKPIISTELGTGTSWVNVDEETGFVVQPKDSGALVKAINKILENKNLEQKFSENAKKRAEQKFSLERMLEETEKVYKNL